MTDKLFFRIVVALGLIALSMLGLFVYTASKVKSAQKTMDAVLFYPNDRKRIPAEIDSCIRVIIGRDSCSGRVHAEPPVIVCSDTVIWRGYPENPINHIRQILERDKKRYRLLDVYPPAVMTMYLAADKYEIDLLLLPAICRAEGPSLHMLKYHNPYGLERNGKLIKYKSFHESTEAAAKLIAKLTGSGPVDIETLAAKWCPANKKQWAENVIAIYNGAMK